MKTKIQIESIFGKLLFEYECEDNTIAKTVSEAYLYGANLRGANLSGANLSGANLYGANLYGAYLYGANLRGANLSGANLSGANLREANLRGANLRGAYLYGAKTDKRYIQISCIGSAKRMTTYCFEDDEILCGCFKGTLAEFEEKCKETHKDNPQYLDEYLGAINYIRSIAKYTPTSQSTEVITKSSL